MLFPTFWAFGEEGIPFPLNFLVLYQKSTEYRCENFWIFNPISLTYMSFLMLIPHCFDYGSFVVSFEMGKCESFNFVFDFKIFPGSLAFPCKF